MALDLSNLRQAQGQYEAEQKKKKGQSSGNTDKYIAGAQLATKMMSSGEEGGQTTDSTTGMAQGAVSGAATGSAFGPYGAAIGAVAGGIMGAASANSARRAKNKQIEAQKLKNIGDIKQREGEQIANVLAK